MALLHEQMQQADRVAITAVVGMGGVGKTELALQYAQQHWPIHFPGGVCWLEARDLDVSSQILTFGKGYLGLTPPNELDANAQVAYCWRHWPSFAAAGQPPQPVLVVLDDVTEYAAVERYLPREPRFTVLMTTRVDLGSGITKLPIGVLDPADALELLQQLAGADRVRQDLDGAMALCEWLGNLPLGLELAGRYLARKPDLSLAGLQQRLQAKELQAPALSRVEAGMTANLGVASAFELSWQDLSVEAQELACLLSCFALAPIPWHRVGACWPDADPENLEDLRDDELCQFSLLKRIEPHHYQFHQLIQRFIRTKLPADSSLITVYCSAMVAAAKEMNDSPTQVHVIAWGNVSPHVAEAATQWISHIGDEDIAYPFVSLGRFYEGQGFYFLAWPWYEKCVAATRNRLGHKHPKLATSLNDLASVYQYLGQYIDAKRLYEESLALQKLFLGDEHTDVAQSLTKLAGLYEEQGLYSSAERAAQKSLELYRKLLSDSSPDLAKSLTTLGLIYQVQGRYNKAEPLLLEAVVIYKNIFSDKHPDVAQGINGLALLYEEQGRYSEAEVLYQESLEISKRLLGDKHPDIAISLNNLALVYKSQGRYEEAETFYNDALKMSRSFFGNKHPDVALIINNLARLHEEKENDGEAEQLYKEAMEIYVEVFGFKHPDVASSLNNLGGIYCYQGRYSEAEPFLKDSLLMRKQLLGSKHPDIATSLNDLALLYEGQKRYSEAESLYKESLEMSKELLGEHHPSIAISLNNLAGLYTAQRRYNEAEKLYKDAFLLSKKALGSTHPDVADNLINLASFCTNQERYSDAEALYLEILLPLLQHIGEEHPTTKMVLENFVYCLQNALNAGQSSSLSNHPTTRTLLTHLQANSPN